jgi:hypothetical protein
VKGEGDLIDTIIAGHTHRPVFENLSLTERMHLEGKMGNMGRRGRKSPISDRAYYNTGSCVHPRCITGIEITPGPDGQPAFTLIKWGYATECVCGPEKPEAGCGAYTLTIQREELEN